MTCTCLHFNKYKYLRIFNYYRFDKIIGYTWSGKETNVLRMVLDISIPDLPEIITAFPVEDDCFPGNLQN